MSDYFTAMHTKHSELLLRIQEDQNVARIWTILTCKTLGIPPVSKFAWPSLEYHYGNWRVVGNRIHLQEKCGYWFYFDLNSPRTLVRLPDKGIAFTIYEGSEYRIFRLDMEGTLDDP